jgi:AcrR family transcriptional regulator
VTATAPTRDRLLAAARQTVEEDGYSAASVAAVASRAGVAAGTLYRHFPSKEDLFVELFRTVCDREVEAMREAGEDPSIVSETERIVCVLATFAARALRRPRLAWALLAEPVDPLVDAERLAYRARYRELLAEGLRQAIDAGELPGQDVEVTSAALVGGCGEVLVGPLAAEGPAPAELIGELRRFVLRAIGGSGGADRPGGSAAPNLRG